MEKPINRVRDKEKTNKISESQQTCYRCGGTRHSHTDCRFKEAVCRSCGKTGHIARVCRSNKPASGPTKTATRAHSSKKPTAGARAYHIEDSCSETVEYTYDSLYSITDTSKRAYIVKPRLNGVEEVDTGASISLISERTYERLWPVHSAPAMQPTGANLRTYTGERIEVLGKIDVEVAIRSQTAQLSLLVVKGSGPSLLGVDWLEKLKLDWNKLHLVRGQTELQSLLEKHSAVFEDRLGCIKDIKAKFYLKPDSQPKFCRARSVPFALREKVEKELKRLQEAGVIEPVQHSEWATPIVPVVKQDGDIRICGDYKITLNQATRVDSYPLPRIDDLLGSLAGGQSFSKVDLAHAYMQIQLEDESKPLTTIHTHRGLYQYTRLPFGISSAPAMFQRTMEAVLQGIPQAFVYIDDILVTGKTESEHLDNLNKVLGRLAEAGIRLKKDKCAA